MCHIIKSVLTTKQLVEVANHRFSKRLLKCEKIVMCCGIQSITQHDLRGVLPNQYKLYVYCAKLIKRFLRHFSQKVASSFLKLTFYTTR